MNTQCTFSYNCPPREALEIAHKTLLSFNVPKKIQGMDLDFVDSRAMCAFAIVKYPYDGYSSFPNWDIYCLVTIETLSDSNCKIVVSADHTSTASASGKGPIICFMADFIKRFSAAVLEEQQKDAEADNSDL